MDDAVDGEHETLNSNEIIMLLNPSKIFLRVFNNKWNIGRRWLFWSKPSGGRIVGVTKCKACEKFKLGGIYLRIWGGSGSSKIQLSVVKNMRNPMITSGIASGGLRNTIHQVMDM
jgi:hypothetical protein